MKKIKRMQMGGKVMNPALAASMNQTSPRGMGTNDGGPTPSSTGNLGAVKTPVPVRGGGGVPLQGPGGRPGPRRGPAMPYGGMGGPVKTGLGRPIRGRGTNDGGPTPSSTGSLGAVKTPIRGMMRGGGLARKGVGMALAKGGLVKANGCAQRGKTKGKMV